MMTRITRILLVSATLFSAFTARAISAQELRGTIVQVDSTPASGVVVMLMHPTLDSVYARAVTGERGLFTLRAPAPGTVRIKLLRLGYQPTIAGPYTLATGEVQTVRVVTGERRIALATLDVRSDSKCNVRPDSALLVAKLYEEARKALIASATPISSERNLARFTLYTRSQDEHGKLVAAINRTAFSGPSSRPFASLPPDSLAKVGYVTEEREVITYRAPDADVLLANSFLQTHCLQFVQGAGERAQSIGIGFRPVDRKRGMVDVVGTLWLDRATNELQTLEFGYEGLPDVYTKMNVGGTVEYTQLSAGMWFVNRWAIRMPRLVGRNNPTINGTRGQPVTNLVLEGLVVTGGEVQSIKADDDMLYTNNSALIAGAEPRDMRDYSSTGGDFSVSGSAAVATKEVKLTGAVDSVFTTSSCTESISKDYGGQVQGRVRSLDNKSSDSLPVVAEWKEDFKLSGQRDFTWAYRRVETRSKSNGNYVICGLPLNRVVSLMAIRDGRKSRVASVKMTSQEPRSSMELTIGDRVGTIATTADLNGKGALLLISDYDGNAISYASVTINGGMLRVSDQDGRVVVNSAPRDSMPLIVRRVGFQSFDGKAVRDSANGTYRVTLAPTAQMMGVVNVQAKAGRSRLETTGFYSRVTEVQRGAVNGLFFPPEELNARGPISVSQLVQGRTSVVIANGPRSHVMFGRSRVGAQRCVMSILLDGLQVRGLITDPDHEKEQRDEGKIDLEEIVNMGSVMAVEVYMNGFTAPTSLTSKVSDPTCGIIALWTGPR